jgi:hypothetical protein
MIDAAVLASLPADAVLSVQVRVGDLRAALQEQQGGPEYVSPREAHERFGRSVSYWRRAAPDMKERGDARQDESGRWLLRSAACRAMLAGRVGASVPTPTTTTTTTTTRRFGRGPRKAHHPPQEV